MVTTPWDIWGDFNRTLADRTTAEHLATNQFSLQRLRDMGDAQAATTLYDRQLAKDEIDFGQARTLADENRQFLHDEAILKDQRAGNKKHGRAGYVTAPTSGVPGPVPTGGNYTPQYAYKHLISAGAPPMLAAGIVGNVAAESGWDPAVFEGRRLGDSGTAYGAAQWRGSRQEHLFEYARSRGHQRPTFEDQLEFFLVEAQSGRDPQASKAIQRAAQAGSAEEAAQIIMDGYERPRDQSSAGVRRAAARNIFAGGDPILTDTGGTGNEDPITAPPRRYTDPVETASTPFPTAADQQPTQTGTEDPSGFYAPQRAWSTEDYIANGINNRDLLGIDFNDFDVVDTEFYSGAQLELMDPSMQSLLHPVGGYAPNETNQYLILQPKSGAKRRDSTGLPLETDRDNTIGGGDVVEETDPTVMPTAPDTGIAAAPVPLPQQAAAPIDIPAPAVASPISTAPTGQRTRRNAQGQLEFNVDGMWVPSGG